MSEINATTQDRMEEVGAEVLLRAALQNGLFGGNLESLGELAWRIYARMELARALHGVAMSAPEHRHLS